MTRKPTTRSLRFGWIAAVIATAAFVGRAWSGEYFEKDGVALRGYDAVAYFKDSLPVKGAAEHKAEYKGSTFHFASKANRDAFVADPARYAPQNGGFCAFGMSGGYKAALRPFGVHCRRRQALPELQPRRPEAVECGHSRIRLEGGQELARGLEPDQGHRIGMA